MDTQFDNCDIYEAPDLNKPYWCTQRLQATGMTLPMKWVLLTKKHDELHEQLKKYFKLFPEKINQKNVKGYTVLHIAVSNTKTHSTEQTVKLLIDLGADVNSVNNNGYTSLVFASAYCADDSTEQTVKILLDAGCDVNYQNKNDGTTALMHAACRSHGYSSDHTVKMLIDHGCDMNIQNHSGWTALTYTIICYNSHSSLETLKMLLVGGTDIYAQNNDGWNALMIAAKYSDDVVRIIGDFILLKKECVIINDDNIGIGFDVDDECTICVHQLLDKKMGPCVKISKCNHGYHANCIYQWLLKNNTCPLCRLVVYSPTKMFNKTIL